MSIGGVTKTYRIVESSAVWDFRTLFGVDVKGFRKAIESSNTEELKSKLRWADERISPEVFSPFDCFSSTLFELSVWS